MSYTPYVDVNLIVQLFQPIVAIGNSSNTDRVLPNAGGYVIGYPTLNLLQEQAETAACARLRKYYVYPLETTDGETEIDNFDTLTRGVIKGYLLACNVLHVANFVLNTVGVPDARKLVEQYVASKESYEDLLFALDQNTGQVYPALDSLKYSNNYIPRQDNPNVQTKRPATVYSPFIDESFNFSGKWSDSYLGYKAWYG